MIYLLLCAIFWLILLYQHDRYKDQLNEQQQKHEERVQYLIDKLELSTPKQTSSNWIKDSLHRAYKSVEQSLE